MEEEELEKARRKAITLIRELLKDWEIAGSLLDANRTHKEIQHYSKKVKRTVTRAVRKLEALKLIWHEGKQYGFTYLGEELFLHLMEMEKACSRKLPGFAEPQEISRCRAFLESEDTWRRRTGARWLRELAEVRYIGLDPWVMEFFVRALKDSSHDIYAEDLLIALRLTVFHTNIAVREVLRHPEQIRPLRLGQIKNLRLRWHKLLADPSFLLRHTERDGLRAEVAFLLLAWIDDRLAVEQIVKLLQRPGDYPSLGIDAVIYELPEIRKRELLSKATELQWDKRKWVRKRAWRIVETLMHAPRVPEPERAKQMMVFAYTKKLMDTVREDLEVEGEQNRALPPRKTKRFQE